MAYRDETDLVDINEAVVPVELSESVNVAKVVELIEAQVQATNTEINEGLWCDVEKERIDAVPSSSNLSINSSIMIV